MQVHDAERAALDGPSEQSDCMCMSKEKENEKMRRKGDVI